MPDLTSLVPTAVVSAQGNYSYQTSNGMTSPAASAEGIPRAKTADQALLVAPTGHELSLEIFSVQSQTAGIVHPCPANVYLLRALASSLL